MKNTLLFLFGLTSFFAVSQVWNELPAQYSSNQINGQSFAIDAANNNKYSFFVDGNGAAIVSLYDETASFWNELTNSFTLVGSVFPKNPSILVDDNKIVIGFYDDMSGNYYIFYDDGLGAGFEQVGTPIPTAGSNREFSKLTFQGDFSNTYLLRYRGSDVLEIDVTKIDVPGQTTEDYSYLPVTTPTGEISNPDIFVSNSHIWVICEEYTAFDEASIYKCAIGDPGNWELHSSIGSNLDEFQINGDPADFPYFAYEDVGNNTVFIDKVSAAGVDNVSQQVITGTGIESLTLTRNNTDEVFIAYKDLNDNKIKIKKNVVNTLIDYGVGEYGSYVNYGLINLVFSEYRNALNMLYTVPVGAPGIGGHLAFMNNSPTTTGTIEQPSCANTNYSTDNYKVLDFTMTDLNTDSTYVYAVNSSIQTIIPNTAISISNSNYVIGAADRESQIFINESINPGLTDLTVKYTDGIDSNQQVFTFEVKALPVINFTSDPVSICNSADLYDLNSNITSPLGGSFAGSNLFDPTIHSAGESIEQYYTYQDPSTQCIKTDTFSMVILDVPTINILTNNSSCGASDGTADAVHSSVNGPTVIYWNTGHSVDNLTNLSPGTYYANVTDAAGCLSIEQAHINATEIVLSSNITDASCFGANDGEIDLTATGNGPFLFLWATADSTEDISNLAAGSYFVTATDATGCNTTAIYEIGQPDKIEFNTTIVNSSCAANDGQIFTGTPSGGDGFYNYWWQDNVSTNAVATNLAAESYAVAIFDNTGCTSDTAFVQVTDQEAPTISASVVNSDCNMNNGSIEINFNRGLDAITSTQWSNLANTQNISGLAPGTYNILVTDTAGCFAAKSIQVQPVKPLQNDICVVTVDSATTTNLVAWERTELTDVDHYNIYRENALAGAYVKIDEVDASELSEFVDLAASPEVRSWRYKISATDECGIEGPKSLHHKTIHIVYQQNGADFDIFWDNYQGFSYPTFFVDRKDAINPEWVEVGQVNFGNAITITDTPPTTNGLDYRVTVQSPGTCSTTKANDYNSSRSNRSSGIFAPGDADSVQSIIENELSYEVSIYPNPTTSVIHFNVSEMAQINMVELTNANGQIIRNEKLNGTNVEIDLSNFESGIYYVMLTTNHGKSVHKVIKK